MPLRSHEALHDLELLVRSRHGLIHLDTPEEGRAEALLHHLADRIGVPLFVWSRARGLRRIGLSEVVYDTAELPKALTHTLHSGLDALYHFSGLSTDQLAEEITAALLRECTTDLTGRRGAMVLTGPQLSVPGALTDRVTRVLLPTPSTAEFRALLSQIVRDMSERQHVSVELAPEELELLMNHLAGLTLMEAEKVLTRALVEDGTLSAEDLRHVVEQKRRIVEQDGLLEYYPVEASLDEVADLVGFKRWLSTRTAVVRDPARAREMGLPFPRGVLLTGIPGCGKSLSAKAVASEWRLPLLRLDPSALYNKYIGETERNFRRAMNTAERIAPVVLWIDEIEKAFASGGDADGGVSRRILGSFLSWMQERRGDVFVVATANEVRKLPPEFLRKGRFDELFFVDLPDATTRAEILAIHLVRREIPTETIDLAGLAARTDGFSGSELEEVVVSALYTAFADGDEVEEGHLQAALEGTRPLSVTMRERIETLRSWAQERTVPAN